MKINSTANLHALWTCHSVIVRVNVKATPDLYYDSEDLKQMLMDAVCYVISMKPTVLEAKWSLLRKSQTKETTPRALNSYFIVHLVITVGVFLH